MKYTTKDTFPIYITNRYVKKQVKDYFIGIAYSDDKASTGIYEALQTGLGNNLQNTDVKYYIADGSSERMTEICNQFLQDSQGYPRRAFIASKYSNEFTTAQQVLGNDILVLSIAATAENIFPNQNALSLAYTDRIAAISMTLAMIYNRNIQMSEIQGYISQGPFFIQPQNLYIIAFTGSPYADGYIANIQQALQNVPPPSIQLQNVQRYNRDDLTTLETAFETLGNTIQQDDIVVYIGFTPDITEKVKTIIEGFPSIFMYISDTSEDWNLNFQNIKTYVVVNSYMNYTEATRNLYQTIYQMNPDSREYASAYVPFSYDCTRQLRFMIEDNLEMTSNNFAITKTTGEYQKAALETNWITPENQRPEYGLYWFTQTEDPFWSNHISDFNRMTLGSVYTLPNSASNGFRIGTSSWVVKSGYLITVIWWDDVYNLNGDWIFTRLTTQGLTIDTSQPYQSNQNRNQNVGTYVLQFDVAVAPSYGKANQVDVKQIEGISQFPLTVRRTRLLI